MKKEVQKTLSNNEKIEVLKPQKKKKQVFKPYTLSQDFLLPKKISDFLDPNHIATLISKIIDSMDISHIEETYKGGGTSAYEPRMLLKVWILGFIYKIYTCRPLAKTLHENLPFIWISGTQTPDFHTLNNFRLRLKDDIKSIFKEIVQYAIEIGLIDGKEVFVDHSKTEANANKHKIVWKKQVERQLVNIDKELDELFDYIDELNEKEDKKYGGKDLPENRRDGFDDDKVKELIDKINSKRKDNQISQEEGVEARKKVRRTKQLLDREVDYKIKKEVVGKRNSFSKTDIDAVAMMQKDKVSIKPAYNDGIATQNGFILNYILDQNCADNVSFIPLMNGVIENTQVTPDAAVTDAGYGNEENHSYLKEKKIGNYAKYNTYHKEKSKTWREKRIRFSNFKYDKKSNDFICPNNEKLSFVEEKESITATNFKRILSVYKTQKGICKNCPLKSKCLGLKNKSQTRSLEVSWNGEELKLQAKNNLNSEKGKELRNKRANEVETIFGDQKLNRNKRRFVLRGLKKVNIEAGLSYIAHNLRKIYLFELKKQLKTQENVKIVKDLQRKLNKSLIDLFLKIQNFFEFEKNTIFNLNLWTF